MTGAPFSAARPFVPAEDTPAMADEHSSREVDHWETRLGRDFDSFQPNDLVESDVVQSWFGDADLLREGREGRLTEAPRFIPATIWVLLLLAGLAVIGFALLLADSRERRSSQIAMVVAVTTAVGATLLIVNFLDRPYGTHEGAIEPAAMRSALGAVNRDLVGRGRGDAVRCDSFAAPSSVPADG